MKSATFSAITALLTAFTPLFAGEEAKVTNFIRVDEDASAARLQTAVTRYEKDGAKVDLVGAIHIADKAYYEKLTERFKSYDRLLFEMVGGEKFANGEAAAEAAEAAEKPDKPDEPGTADKPEDGGGKPEKKKDLSGLHRIYDMVAKFLKLTGQTEAIDYRTANFLHADLTMEEFETMQKERKESLLGFAMKANDKAAGAKQPDPAKMLNALLSGKSDALKLEIVHTLGQGDDQIASLAGESVIITDRNKRCLEVMDKEIAAGRKTLGIFYGAAHFPDMEKQLLAKGYKRVGQEWFTAWDIPKEKALPEGDKEAPAKAGDLKKAA